MKALVLLSGGVDSATCVGMAVHQYGSENVIALSITYGQKHFKEIEAARSIAAYYGIEWIQLDLSKIFASSRSALMAHSEKVIEKRSYALQIEQSDGQPVSTYVPFRNGLFLSSAASIALSKDCSVIYYGAHRDDAAGNAYPDCSESFNEAIKQAVFVGSGEQLRIEAPFIGMSKEQIVEKGLFLNVPYEMTWSCYEGADRPCGKCGTCLDRRAAFNINGVPDPLLEL